MTIPSRRKLLLAGLGIGVGMGAGLTAFGPARAQSAKAPPLRLVASFSILADLLRQIAPPDAEVSALVGPEGDAHSYAPTPGDVKRLAAADLVAINGLGFEGWIERLVKASGYRGVLQVASAGLVPRQVGATPDPHAWHDPANARLYVRNLSAALQALRPAQAASVRERTDAYLQQIDRFDQGARTRLGAIPESGRRVITSHGGFGYLGGAYGLEFLSPLGWRNDQEPSAAAVARLIAQIRKLQVRAVFIDSLKDSRLMQQIARDSGAVVGGQLHGDALTRPGGEADSYLRLMEHNVATLASALGTAPAPRN